MEHSRLIPRRSNENVGHKTSDFFFHNYNLTGRYHTIHNRISKSERSHSESTTYPIKHRATSSLSLMMARTTTSADSVATTTSFPFMRLPVELRSLIVEEYAINFGIQYQVQGEVGEVTRYGLVETKQFTKTRENCAPLAMTCKTIKSEYKTTVRLLRQGVASFHHNFYFLENWHYCSVRSLIRMQKVLDLGAVTTCTLSMRMDWHASRPEMKDIFNFIRLPKNAAEVRVDILCRPGGPLDEQWHTSANLLRDQVESSLKLGFWASADRWMRPHRKDQKLPNKLSVCLRAEIDGKPCAWYLLHKEMRYKATGTRRGRSEWVDTSPEESAEDASLVYGWPKERILPRWMRKIGAEKAKPWPKDARFEW